MSSINDMMTLICHLFSSKHPYICLYMSCLLPRFSRLPLEYICLSNIYVLSPYIRETYIRIYMSCLLPRCSRLPLEYICPRIYMSCLHIFERQIYVYICLVYCLDSAACHLSRLETRHIYSNICLSETYIRIHVSLPQQKLNVCLTYIHMFEYMPVYTPDISTGSRYLYPGISTASTCLYPDISSGSRYLY